MKVYFIVVGCVSVKGSESSHSGATQGHTQSKGWEVGVYGMYGGKGCLV